MVSIHGPESSILSRFVYCSSTCTVLRHRGSKLECWDSRLICIQKPVGDDCSRPIWLNSKWRWNSQIKCGSISERDPEGVDPHSPSSLGSCFVRPLSHNFMSNRTMWSPGVPVGVFQLGKVVRHFSVLEILCPAGGQPINQGSCCIVLGQAS